MADKARRLIVALAKIARGRTDNGRPLGGLDAQIIARGACVDLGIDWNSDLASDPEEKRDG
jgi:hypothetical protein